MTQVTNYAVPNAPRAEVRMAFNNVLAALRDDNAGPTAPLNPVPFMVWKDTSGGGEGVYRVMNAANSAWLLLADVMGVLRASDNLASLTDKPAALAQLLGNTSLSGLQSGHGGGPVFLVMDSNRAIGATEPTNPAFWAASEVVGGVTFTRVSSDVDPVTGNTRVTYDCVGTMTAATASFGYVSNASLTNGLSGENWTASAFAAVTGPAGGGGGAAQAGTGFRMFQFQTGASPTSVVGNSVTGARALSTVSRLLGINGTVRCGFQVVGSIGTAINARVVVEGVQFERAAARTSLQYRESLASEAARLMNVGRRLIRTATAANSATVVFNSTDLNEPSGVYEVIFDGVTPSVSNANLICQVSSDNGVTWEATGVSYTHASTSLNSALISAPSGGDISFVPITVQGLSNTAGINAANGQILMSGLGQARSAMFSGRMASVNQSGFLANEQIATVRRNTAPVNAIRFLMTSGNIASGTFTLMGVPK